MRCWTNLACVALCLLLGCSRDPGDPPPDRRPIDALAPDGRPNLLLIILDDVGFEYVGGLRRTDGDLLPRTPNIDALIARGLTFQRCYAYPRCSPTRATILTGRYGFRTGVGTVVRRDGRGGMLPDDEHTLAEALSAAGYDNSLVGKWHLGDGQHVLRAGWRWAAGTAGNIVDPDAGRTQLNPRPRRPPTSAPADSAPAGTELADSEPADPPENYWHWPKTTNGVQAWCDRYATTETTDDAIARMAAMRPPWLLWLAYNAVHAPWHTPPAHMHRYAPEQLERSPRLRAYAMTESVDCEIGRLLAALSPAAREQTVVVLLSDNGPQLWSRGPRGISADTAKGALSVAGCNVPLVVAGPCIPPALRGQRSDALVSTTDLFPTLLALGRAPLPGDRAIDGVSLLPIFEGSATAVREFALAEKFGETTAAGDRPNHQIMLTDGQWRLHHVPGAVPTLHQNDAMLTGADRETATAQAAERRLRAGVAALLGDILEK